MVMAVAGGTALLTGGVLAVAQASTGVPDRGPARSSAQPIRWHGCQTGPDDELGKALDAASAQCGEVRVPLDYARPDGRTITVAMSRITATDPAHRRGALLINPGGPGVP